MTNKDYRGIIERASATALEGDLRVLLIRAVNDRKALLRLLSKLPTSGDGSPITPGMNMWCIECREAPYRIHVDSICERKAGPFDDRDLGLAVGVYDQFGGSYRVEEENCFCTKRAAVVALAKRPKAECEAEGATCFPNATEKQASESATAGTCADGT